MGNVCVSSCAALNCGLNVSDCLRAFCLACRESIIRLGKIFSFESKVVTFHSVRTSDLAESVLPEYPLRCFNAPHGCPFEGSLDELKQHVQEGCADDPVTCRNCGNEMSSSQLADHNTACNRKTDPIGFSGYRASWNSEQEGVVDDAKGRSTYGSESLKTAVNFSRSPPKPASGEYSDDVNLATIERMPLMEPKCRLHLGDDNIRLARQRPPPVRQPHHFEYQESDVPMLDSAPVHAQSSGVKSKTEGHSSTIGGARSREGSDFSPRKKSPIRPTDIGPRRSPKMSAAALNAALAYTARALRPTDSAAATVDMMSSLSEALKKLSCGSPTLSVTEQARDNEDAHLVARTASVPKRSFKRWPATRLQALRELDTIREDSGLEENSAELNAASAGHKEGASESGGLVGTSRVHEAGNPEQQDVKAPSSGVKIGEEALGAVGGRETSNACRSQAFESAAEQLAKVREIRHFRKITFTFIELSAVRKVLETETTVVVQSKRYVIYGYTFTVKCRFRGLAGLTVVAFGLSLRSGEYDDWCRWPFNMNIFIEVIHPREGARNIQVCLCPRGVVPAAAFSKPEPGLANPGWFSQDYAWTSIVKAGYVASDALSLDVWFDYSV